MHNAWIHDNCIMVLEKSERDKVKLLLKIHTVLNLELDESECSASHFGHFILWEKQLSLPPKKQTSESVWMW
jgi:hypothetical protein